MENRKPTLLALSQFVHHHLPWLLISAYAIAAVFPTAGLWIRNVTFGNLSIFQTNIHGSLLLLLLATLMFNAGLGVQTSHLQSLVRKVGVLVAGLAANILIPIAYIFCVTLLLQLWHNPEETQHILVGLALVAAMPIAGASTAWAQNSNGNLALSLGLVLSSTLLSPVVTPMAFYVFGEMASDEYETLLHNLADYGSGTFLGLWGGAAIAPGALYPICGSGTTARSGHATGKAHQCPGPLGVELFQCIGVAPTGDGKPRC